MLDMGLSCRSVSTLTSGSVSSSARFSRFSSIRRICSALGQSWDANRRANRTRLCPSPFYALGVEALLEEVGIEASVLRPKHVVEATTADSHAVSEASHRSSSALRAIAEVPDRGSAPEDEEVAELCGRADGGEAAHGLTDGLDEL